MTDRYDALAIRNYIDKNGETKAAFTRIGTMFANSKGGFSLTLDALPTPSLNDKGAIETRILLVEPKQDGSNSPRQQGGGNRSRQMDDDIPGF